MIDLYYWPTPNGHKISIALEEFGLPYKLHPINISKDDQFAPDFLKVSPNNKIPAIVDNDPADGKGPLSVFESGAILEYLADKTGKLLPKEPRARFEVLQWVYWQMGGLGPMAGQNHHFGTFAPEKIPYAINRYEKETARLYGVLDKQIGAKDYVCGTFSIADIISYPWVRSWKRQNIDIEQFPSIKRWMANMEARPSVIKSYSEIEQSVRPAS